MLVKIPAPLKWLYPQRVWNLPISVGMDLFLTFDDGPIPEITPWVLDQLKAYNASATFFCIGDNVRKHPLQFKRIIEENHAIGNHTYNHLNGWKTSQEVYIKNVLEAEETMTSFDHPLPSRKLFRPPYGRANLQQEKALRQLGYEIIMWDVLSMDYDQKISPQRCFRNVVKHARAGSIIVFHDSLKAERNLREVLPKVLEHFARKGYNFKSL